MITWISIAARVGVVLTVLAIGLRASFADATWLLRRPAKLGRALVAMNVIVPIFVIVMVSQFELRPIVKIVLVALSVAPIPPFLPTKALRGGGDSGYTIGLFVVASVLAVVFVPLATALFGGAVSVSSIATIMVVTVLAPLTCGMVIRRWAPAFAERAAKPASIAGLVVLLGALVPIAIVAMPIATAKIVGEGTLLALAAFVGVGLLVGHVLGGPRRSERTVLALTTSSRHPGVAFVVASAISADDDKVVLATVFLYMLVCVLVSLPYSLWSNVPRGGGSAVARDQRGETHVSVRDRTSARRAGHARPSPRRSRGRIAISSRRAPRRPARHAARRYRWRHRDVARQ
jgi:BASS family bile acid:Na+ symporter